jgi:hypothetical protein
MIDRASKDYEDLKIAVNLLESPSITAKIASVIGSPIEAGLKKLPNGAQEKIQDLVKAALHKAADAALWSLENKPETNASTIFHKAMAATSGAIGGAFGFTALAVELPVTTTIMLRSIADIARSEGFDLSEFETKQACMEVFALGGETEVDDAAESGYYAVRTFMTEATTIFAKKLAEITAQNAAKKSFFTPTQASSWIVAIIEKIAARFGIVITQKVAAQAVPIVGGIAGATLNTMFTDFYQDMARGHFIVKRLEKKYGYDHVKAEYDLIRNKKG